MLKTTIAGSAINLLYSRRKFTSSCQLSQMWPVTVYTRIPSIPPPSEVEAQLASTSCAGESPAQPVPSRSLSRRAGARKDVSAGCSRVESLLGKSVVGEGSIGAQHVGTGMGLGGIRGRRGEGSSRKLAARSRVAVVKVIANATAKRS